MPSLPAHRSSRVALAVGCTIALLGATADLTGLSSQPGFGLLQVGMIGVGLVVALWGLLEARPKLRRGLGRVMLTVGSIYLGLWIIEAVLAYPLNPARGVQPPFKSMPGLYEPGEIVSYRHTPGYTGTFDDGIVQVPISINSRGDRDAEPRLDVPRDHRMLLVGDSFTFGHALTAEQTIDGRIEARSRDQGPDQGEVDAYNLGVMAYGPGDTYQRLQESSWWDGRSIYYLFFMNDLQNNNARPGLLKVHGDWALPVYADDGHAYTVEEWDAMVAHVLEHGAAPGQVDGFGNTFTLRRLRGMARAALHRDLRLTGFADELFSDANIDAALGYTEQMKAIADERGSNFTVVIIPARGEAIADEYSRWTQAYVDGLEARGVEAIELLDRLEGQQYFRHDPHFNPDGADVTAQVILEHFRHSPEPPAPATVPKPDPTGEHGPHGEHGDGGGHGGGHGHGAGPNAEHHGHGHTQHHRFEDAEKWAEMFDAPTRDQWQRPEAVIDFIAPAADAVIADLGAGTGYFAVRMARRVPEGRVLANDIEADMVRYLGERAKKEGLDNLVPVQGQADDPALSQDIDIAFMCDVYHHIADRTGYFRKVAARLRPGGRLVIVDFKKDAPADIPGPPPAMRVAQDVLVTELAEAGFSLSRADRDTLPHQYIVELIVTAEP